MVAGNPSCDTAAGPPAVKFLRPRPVQPGKPLFVFLPGMDGTGELLRPQLDRLTPWFDLRALAISPQDFSDWAPLARQVNCLIRQELGLDAAGKGAEARDRPRRVYLCGESFGGCLAMQVLALSPQLFERAILVNPASSFRRLPWMQLGSVLTRQLPASLYRYSSRGIVPFLIELESLLTLRAS